MKTERECPECGGGGEKYYFDAIPHIRECPFCHGTGRIEDNMKEGD